MENKYKTFEELKDELGDKLAEYMYGANINLLTKIEKIEKHLEKSIESINQKLLVENGRIINMNDYQIVRLKAIRMKCKEILKMLKEE